MIREATLADAAALAAIYGASEGAIRHLLGAGAVESVDLAGWFAERFTPDRSPVERLWIADGLGFVETAAPDELQALYVVPEHWGSGVAASLQDRALAHLAGYVTRAELVVIARNARARRFYERGGWQLVGDAEPRTIGGLELAFVRYARAL